ncbi:MAG: hypothetical protein BRC51_06150 [Cyanobacteria bacterium SW_12_48_29]|nr:MAG: hypothetical protein BRC45_08415 [Cyanobacteria bacterium QS_5_48_63]PSO88000.1 MAG: hypothetical protein BRC43_07980 [Cyanobacteria bacterium QS_3_48_167]PSP04301.1 MAG: hypothetical protein BRC54_11165 [Cyanobacteria bacterium SW_7_48_12]PSP05076.1 MAG: hypothetical protein BRC51_06150 [Cyanobacteria bacterium SW_12_48_29]PSP13258.1 MAG: hypothetical protein BRC49_02775 [Cyanobacteria bacterium SW_10_48_33]PSP20960.1 MAG: hypothetical protein BRC52_07535 [Cyanobacteria bacterium SW_5
MDTHGEMMEVVMRAGTSKGLVPLPRSGVLERSWGWFHCCRRFSKDDEVLPQTSEAFIYVAKIRLMLRPLA